MSYLIAVAILSALLNVAALAWIVRQSRALKTLRVAARDFMAAAAAIQDPGDCSPSWRARLAAHFLSARRALMDECGWTERETVAQKRPTRGSDIPPEEPLGGWNPGISRRLGPAASKALGLTYHPPKPGAATSDQVTSSEARMPLATITAALVVFAFFALAAVAWGSDDELAWQQCEDDGKPALCATNARGESFVIPQPAKRQRALGLFAKAAGTGWTPIAGAPTCWERTFAGRCTYEVARNGRCSGQFDPLAPMDFTPTAYAGRYQVPVVATHLAAGCGFANELNFLNYSALAEEAFLRTGQALRATDVQAEDLGYTAGSKSMSAGLYALLPVAHAMCSASGLTVTCNGGSTKRASAVVSWKWKWEARGRYEDGGVSGSHAYATPGRYRVALDVTTAAGTSSGWSGEVTVGAMVPPPPPPPPAPFCGDGTCNSGETCSTCEPDCGACPPTPPPVVNPPTVVIRCDEVRIVPGVNSTGKGVNLILEPVSDGVSRVVCEVRQ